MALMSVVAGPYRSTLGAVDLGIMEKGYNMTLGLDMENVDDTDAYGSTVIEQVLRGSECGIDFICKEYKAAPLSLVTANMGTTRMVATGTSSYKPGQVGVLATTLAGILILTATTGTPAASSPATITATYAIMREGFKSKWLLGPNARKIPADLRIIPSDAGSGVGIFFATT